MSQSIGSPKASSIVIPPTNPNFTSVLNARIRNARFNRSSTPKPVIIIITPMDPTHVSAVVLYAQKVGFHLKTHESAWVQAGAALGEVYHGIWKQSKVHGFPAGVCPTVGAGGHIASGGYGTMIRKYGLSIDHVVDATIVDASGKILDRKAMGEDLFWAIRGGGGGSFGVITSYKIKLVRVPEKVTVFRVQQSIAEKGTGMAFKWQTVAAKTDSNLFTRMLLQVATRYEELYRNELDRVRSLMGKFRTRNGTKGLESLWEKMAENPKVGLTCNSYADATHLKQARALHAFLTPFVSKNPRRAFLNYRVVDIGTGKTWTYEDGKSYGLSYYAANYCQDQS
ncbi:hypothetical protein F3Y22_tig00112127pilonHSYRG00054 [Hibiscus syriacus]|uniref:FAD-binding PCMH-type domain-containing protein n=1 Tax=Hibiscus syriacus TaxID=106335 RepID=A0A6A2XL52_HIBSY|nr:hypothetical protein F3Y22_tig00112127pilonHSYRG00054 [Hibiscus syriacus]